jgi:hypothetical protein
MHTMNHGKIKSINTTEPKDTSRTSSLSYNFILSLPRYCPQAYVEILKDFTSALDFKFQFDICFIRRSLFGLGILCFSSFSLLILSV